MPRNLFGSASAAVVLALALAGCSDSGQAAPGSSTMGSGPAATQSVAAPSGRVSGTPSASTPAPTPERSTQAARETTQSATSAAKAPVEGAYPGAGGPRPENATPATAIYHPEYGNDTAVVITPSGNIGCDLEVEYSGCGVESWMTTRIYPDPMWGSLGWVDLTVDKKPVVAHRGDAPYYKWEDPKPQVLNYGDVVYFKDMVCASEQNGLTCWNTKSGRGALINKSGYKSF